MDEHVYKEQEHFWRIEDGGVRMFLFEGKDRPCLWIQVLEHCLLRI